MSGCNERLCIGVPAGWAVPMALCQPPCGKVRDAGFRYHFAFPNPPDVADMSHDTPTPVRLEDYTPPPFLIEAVKLDVDVRETGTIVRAQLEVQRNPAVAARVDGDALWS